MFNVKFVNGHFFGLSILSKIVLQQNGFFTEANKKLEK